MSHPRERLGRVASRLFDPITVEYVVAPALADLNFECTKARAQPPLKRLRDIIRAYLAFFRVTILCLYSDLNDRPSATELGHGAWLRVLTTTVLVAGVVGTILLIVPFAALGSLEQLQLVLGGNIPRAVVLLAPQATPIAMPAGILFGALFGVRHRPAGSDPNTTGPIQPVPPQISAELSQLCGTDRSLQNSDQCPNNLQLEQTDPHLAIKQ